MNWYTKVLSNYAVFTGRARRSEYWYFALFNGIIYCVLAIIDAVIKTTTSGFGLLSTLYSLAVLVPSLAVLVRRLHDTNRSGFWIFICLIPFAGAIILFVFLVSDSDRGDNQYGPSPKYSDSKGSQYPSGGVNNQYGSNQNYTRPQEKPYTDQTERDFRDSLKKKGYTDEQVESEIDYAKKFAQDVAKKMYDEKYGNKDDK